MGSGDGRCPWPGFSGELEGVGDGFGVDDDEGGSGAAGTGAVSTGGTTAGGASAAGGVGSLSRASAGSGVVVNTEVACGTGTGTGARTAGGTVGVAGTEPTELGVLSLRP